jgi:CHAT domain-containing protein/tetratricopeptide (TPR) repeat protein
MTVQIPAELFEPPLGARWAQAVRRDPGLLGDAFDASLRAAAAELLDGEEDEEDEGLAAAVAELRSFLWHCREVGLEAAAGALEAESAADPALGAKAELVDRALTLEDAYEASGDVERLRQAIEVYQQLRDHPSIRRRPRHERMLPVSELGRLLVRRFTASGDEDDLETAVAQLEVVVAGAAPWSPLRSVFLYALALALRRRYDHRADLEDMRRAIELQRQAVDEAWGATQRCRLLAQLGRDLFACWYQTGERAGLQAAIAAFEEASRHPRPDWPGRPACLAGLGSALQQRYVVGGGRDDLDRAAEAVEEALRAPLGDALQRYELLAVAGQVLVARYEEDGDQRDLERAMARLDEMAATVPSSAPDRHTVLANLAAAVAKSFASSGSLADLDRAIAILEGAADSLPTGYSSRVDQLGNLGFLLRWRHTHSGAPADLERAVAIAEQAVDEDRGQPLGRARRLAGLGSCLHERFRGSGRPEDLDGAVERFEQALAIAPVDSPDWPTFASGLAASLLERYQRRELPADLERAAEQAELALARTAPRATERSLYQYYLACALCFRHRRSGDSADLRRAVDAFREVCAASATTQVEVTVGAPRTWGGWALERHAWDEAAEAYGHGLAAMDRLVADQTLRPHKESWLRAAQGFPARACYALARSGDPPGAVLALERGRALLLNEALGRARPDPGQVDLAEVVAAGRSTPIVYLAATEVGGVALAVGAPGGAEPVARRWLPELTEEAVSRRAAQLHLPEVPDAVAGWCWEAVMRPVLELLEGAGHAVLVPAGRLGLLPLHAAWTPSPGAASGRRYAMDQVAIAYTPNARVLRRARAAAVAVAADTLLAVEEPQPVRAPRLPAAHAEVASISRHFGRPRVLRHEEATKDAVRAALGGATVVHLACHALARPLEPLDSRLLLAGDEALSLRDLLELPRLRVRLAVLSACETGVAGSDLPDEVVSLATGMLQAGCAGVIASHWRVGDTAAAILMARFYHHWRSDGRSPADALRAAQQWLRDSTNGEKARWFHPDRGAGDTSGLWRAMARRDPERRDFVDARHWAAFAYLGA